ncbi:MAG: hypothetical protein GXC73_03935, partial [Chitinophagaceae bacterium]|nr:hypothetical protein [Chitinophagaceae bacterium]
MRYTILFLVFVIVLAACKKTGTDNNSSVDITKSTWRITFFWDVTDKTSGFSSYSFMFSSGGTLMAHGSSSAITGTWNQT